MGLFRNNVSSDHQHPLHSRTRSHASSLVLFLIYLPRGPALPGAPTQKSASAVTLTCMVHLVAMAAATFYLSLLQSSSSAPDPLRPPPPSTALVAWANFLGLQSTVLASVQYVPQLYTTWRLRHVGSLSIPMMCIQTPGSFVWAVSLATREGTRWSSWATYVVTGTLQGVLLVMCVSFELSDRAERRKAVDAGNGADVMVDGERRPLLDGLREEI